MKLSTADVLLTLMYLGLLITLGGAFIYKKVKPHEFMLWNQEYKGGLLGLTFASTAVSSIGFMAMLDIGFIESVEMLVQLLFLAVLSFLAGSWCVNFIRRSKELTLYSYLGKHFGRWATVYGGIAFLSIGLMRSAVTLYMVIKIFLLEDQNSMLMLGLSISGMVCFYVYLSGIAGVIWTNVINVFMKFLGLGVVVICLLLHLTSGAEWKIMESTNFNWLGERQSILYTFLMLAWMLDMFSFGFSQTSAQLYLCARCEESAKKGLGIGLCLTIGTLSLLWLIGCLTTMCLEQSYGMLTLQEPYAPGVFCILMKYIVPPGVKGLFLIAFLTTAFSVINFDLNSMTSLFYHDFYRVYWENDFRSKQKMVNVHRGGLIIGTLLVTLTGILCYWDSEVYLIIWWYVLVVLVSGVLGLLALTVFSNKVSSIGAMIGVAVGSLLLWGWIVIGEVYEAFLLPLSHTAGLLVVPLSVIIITAIGWLSSFIFAKKKQNDI